MPLHPRLTVIMERYLEQYKGNGSPYVFQSPKVKNTPISACEIRINLRKAAEAAGITKRVTPHILRHSVTTHLTVLGVEQVFIAAVLGHIDLRSTSRYQHLCVDNLREVAGVLK
ncbi:tyrosine-type recombinase/integrase [Cytobacillus sp. Hz8]|uniref:tyrosine-type recombinase/integrase n=1 Tax=Cytobacillus sp. Hz8 TaxID=3347168 RepID=UPI0035D844B3